jgi:glycosyltransferase involved in cell wall biosynthesis
MRNVAQATNAAPFSYNWLMAKLERLTIPRAEGIVCITNYTRRAVANLARKTWIIPNAVDASYFDIVRNRESPPIILCVGTICPWKNQNAFIESLDDLAREREFQLIFLGTSAKGDPYCEAFFALLKDRPWCRYEGFANREQLKTYLARATILALPSLEDNCPMAVLEAMAAGLPVAAANVGGVPDLVEDGKTGILFNPKNRSEMRSAIGRFLRNDDGKRMALLAREEALKRFQPQLIAARHLEVYSEVLVNNR